MDTRFKKRMLFAVILSAAIITIGYIFKEEFFFINVGDTYYVMTYFSLSIFIIYLIAAVMLYNSIKQIILKRR